MRAGFRIEFGGACYHLHIGAAVDFTVQLNGAADDVEVGKAIGRQTGTVDADIAAIHAQPDAAVGLFEHAAGA